jgi:tetratricopeptide (TPR) repeat protein
MKISDISKTRAQDLFNQAKFEKEILPMLPPLMQKLSIRTQNCLRNYFGSNEIFYDPTRIIELGRAGIRRIKNLGKKSIISELLKQHPDIHTAHYAMGVICVMRKHYDEAIAYFDKAIEIYPYFVEAWFNKGASHQKKLEVREMLKAYQKVVEIGDPADDFVRHANDVIKEMKDQIRQDTNLTLDQYLKGMDKFNEAFAAMQSKEWEKALSSFQDVVRIDPKHTQSYGSIGICYAHLGQRDKALESLDKALELDPNYEPAILNRATVSSLKEGEKLDAKFEAVDYYKDYTGKRKSLFEGLFGQWK